jgi:hypothetical protein
MKKLFVLIMLIFLFSCKSGNKPVMNRITVYDDNLNIIERYTFEDFDTCWSYSGAYCRVGDKLYVNFKIIIERNIKE